MSQSDMYMLGFMDALTGIREKCKMKPNCLLWYEQGWKAGEASMNKFYYVRVFSAGDYTYIVVNPTFDNDGIRGRFLLKDKFVSVGVWPARDISNFNIVRDKLAIQKYEAILNA